MIIDYNDRTKTFDISCTVMENQYVAGMPSKRYRNSARLWKANCLSLNSKYLLDSPILRGAMTGKALEIANKSVKRVLNRREPFPVWYRFKTNPFNHQRKALDWLWGLSRYAIFAEMGTGKTKIAIDLSAARFMTGEIDSWVVFCPNSVRDIWVDEWKCHSPLSDIPVFIVGDLNKARARKLSEEICGQQRFVAICGIESLQVGHRDGYAYDVTLNIINGRKYAAIVDESHYIKNPDANRSRNIEQLMVNTRYGGVMTGSPIARTILDLYQQFHVLDPDIIGIGDYYSFRNRYAEFGGYENREIVGYKNMDELMGLIKPYVFQCTKSEVLDLPEKLYSKRMVKMADEQSRVYKSILKEYEALIKDLSRGGHPIEVIVEQVLAQYTALQQITGGFINYDDPGDGSEVPVRRTAWIVPPHGNPKVREVIDIAEENPDSQIIIWAKFRNEIAVVVEGLRHRFGPDCVAEFHGGIEPSQRRHQLELFKSGTARFFVANQQTGGTGLTINESNLVIYFSNSFRLVDRIQSEDRNHRIGQKSDVLYIDLVCAGTKDVDILAAIKDKKDLAEWVRCHLGS